LEPERLSVQKAAAPRAPQNLPPYLEKSKFMLKFPILLSKKYWAVYHISACLRWANYSPKLIAICKHF
jgi:hypothetical protein